ncbi:MAG: 3-oxoadipate enol-lactonase [Desulfobacterales bacterium]|nr:MAG: 3-oxoadipate enol-lactonase [Desulfobacterales bacterium]
MKIAAYGIQINYELSGQEGAPVVMLSHSLGSSLAMWNPQIATLEPHFRVLRYDMRGHGGSDAPEGAYSLEQLGNDAVGLLDALAIQKVHWVGLSIGGMIGQSIALNHGPRLQSLVLCDTSAMIPAEAQPILQERIATAREQGLAPLVQGTLERWFTPDYLRRNPPEVERIRQLFLATPVAGYIGCSEAIGHLNYLDRLPEIKTPALIMVGRDDPGTPVAASEAIQARLANSRLVILPSASHLSNVEQAQAFNQNLMAFLTAH